MHVHIDSNAFEKFQEKNEDIISGVSAFNEEKDINKLLGMKQAFANKAADFMREGRKLNIGVVGQVKAGKSSFLNTLLFNGKEILPKASTPKTATLTKMEYAETNRIEIEYYTKEEWDNIKNNAKVDSEDDVYVSAREIIGMMDKRNIRVEELISKKKEVQSFDSYEELLERLNDFVGENGTYTPIVKAVSLFMHNDVFEGISIVDTPGLNDPIVSRTERTREFLEYCDVVFFLSRTSNFLDKNDWNLLSSQLPQKGVKKMVLVASQFDNGLADVLNVKDADDEFAELDDNTADNINDGCTLVKTSLSNLTKEKINSFIKEARRKEYQEEFIRILQDCTVPVFVSAMTENMTKKDKNDYSDEEKLVYDRLEPYSKNVSADLELVGNFAEVRHIYEQVKADKENVLIHKANTLVADAEANLKNALAGFKENAEERVKILESKELDNIEEQKILIARQINGIKADAGDFFDEILGKIRDNGRQAIRELRTGSSEYAVIDEKSGVRTETHSIKVSDSHWYNPFSWGSSHTEYSTYDVHYNYLDASDAVNALCKFANNSQTQIEDVFNQVMDVKIMKKKLIGVVLNNFDSGDVSFDVGFYRLLVQELVNKIKWPVFNMDFSDKSTAIANKFSGEVTDNKEKASLQQMLNSSVTSILKELANQVEIETNKIEDNFKIAKKGFLDSLLTDITKELDQVLELFKNKEEEITNAKKYIAVLEDDLKK